MQCFITVIVVLQFFPKFATISPGLAMLPLLVVLAGTMIKDGYEDTRRHISDRSINNARTRVVVGGGWINPNVTQSKQQSFSSTFKAFKEQMLGGKKRENKKMLAHQKELSARHSFAHDQTPMEPAADAPGGGVAPQTHAIGRNSDAGSGLGPELGRTRTSMSSMRAGISRRQSSMGASVLNSEYEHGDDGRVRHHGRVLNPEEEAQYWAKRAPRWRKVGWEDLKVGDFVLLKDNEAIPADIIVCATSEEEDACYVETKNLDGETNLKVRHAVPELSQTIRTAKDCTEAQMRIDTGPRDTDMYRLNASVVLGDRFDKDGQPLRCPVTINQILLRGCNVRNTRWIIGVVLMTGADTKIIANSGQTPTKRGKVERQMNPMVYVNLLILAAMAVGLAIADSLIEQHFFDRQAYWEYLAIFSDDNPRLNGLVTFGNSLITFQNIVPISLYISIEVVRTIQAYFIFDDYDIYYEKTNRRTLARSWNLADDLGQVEYIFSDKTGTLTQNLMIFREFAVGGTTYRGDVEFGAKAKSSSVDVSNSSNEKEAQQMSEESESSSGAVDAQGRRRVKPANADVQPFKDRLLVEALKSPDTPHGKLLGWFWRTLALCHTVVTGEDEESGALEYKAQSPDEQALVQAAAEVGFIFCGKDRSTLKIQTPYSAEFEKYELLTVLEFSSARKRMSVILRREVDGKILVMTKGADSVIFERSAAGQDEIKEKTDEALEEFANKGLRTLCLGYKELNVEDYDAWARQYHEATVMLEGREERMEELASDLEQDFVLLGATAIEDRLQEGVPETIADLKRAGINVWVATGDKLETAIAIGYSTMLLAKDMNLIVVRGGEYGQPNSAYEQLKRAIEQFFGGSEALAQMENQPPDFDDDDDLEGRETHVGRRSTASAASLVGEDNGQRPGGYALVIDGKALGHALSEEFSKELLLDISTQCKAVICCRVSPLQKALIVKLIKDGLGVMTVAVGDGANDVSMIQAAHVGIGIAGEEGLQAVNSSDYAIAQFRFLKRLILVHGHYCYHRNGNMIINFFYKNWINIFCLFWFQIYCGWSSAQGMDYVYLLFWNAFWTVAAVIGLGIFERVLPDHVLMDIPELYKRSRKGSYFSLRLFMVYLLDSLWQSAVLFFLICYSYDFVSARDDGYDVSLWEWSTTLAMASVVVANLSVGLDIRSWNWFIFAGVWLGPFLIFIFAPIYAAFPPTLIWTYSYGNNHDLYRSATYWFAGCLTIWLALLPRFIWKHIRQTYFPTDIDVIRAIAKYDPKHDFIHDPGMPALRAAKQYGIEVPTSAPNRGHVAGQGAPAGQSATDSEMHAMSPLRPVESRTSSMHYDMATGQARPSRGYTFSADDEPREKRSKQQRSGSVKRRATLSKLGRSLGFKGKRLSIIRHADEPEEEEANEATATDDFAPREHASRSLDPGPEEEEEVNHVEDHEASAR